MIIRDQISELLVKTYSDKNVYIHGGFPEADYAEAIDPANINRTYTETAIPITITDDDYTQVGRILLGVDE